MSARRTLTHVAVCTAVLLIACGRAQTESPSTSRAVSEASAGVDDNRIPVVVDYSPTVSDVPALLLLTQRPDVRLLGVTIPGTGESECDPAVTHTREILTAVGLEDVPVACGPTEPVGPGAEWPAEWRAGASRLAGVDLPPVGGPEQDVDAPDLLIDLVKGSSRPVVIVALAPLTNLALALERDAEFASGVDRVYTMGGAVRVPGNAPGGVAEWNYYIDPTAVELVLGSDLAISMVPLDATNHVPANKRWFYALSRHHTTEAARIVYDLWEANTPFEFPGFYFWDELAALAAVDDSIVAWESFGLFTDVEGPFAGEVRISAGNPMVRVATSAEPDDFELALLTGLNAGLAPPEIQVPEDEQTYFAQLEAARSNLDNAIGDLFESSQTREVEPLFDVEPADLTPDEAERLRSFALDFWGRLFDAALAYHEELAAITAPSSLADAHGAYLEALGAWIATRDQRLSDLAAMDGTETAEHFWDSGADFEAVDLACAVLADEAARRDLYPEICDSAQ